MATWLTAQTGMSRPWTRPYRPIGILLPRIVATPGVRIATAALARADDATLLAIASDDRRKHMKLNVAAMRETERERLRALVQVDMDIAAALHADDYQLITPRGHAMSKQEYLGRIASGRLRYRVFEPVSAIAVRGSGEVALLRYQARISVAEDGADEPRDAGTAGSTGDEAVFTCWHTDCYERRDARWQAVWSQATAIKPD
jgi:hypothetical protein